MSQLKILLVEDVDEEIEVCVSSTKVYEREHNLKMQIDKCKDVNEALKLLDGTYDGAIIDLKLGKDGNEGNQIINEIASSFTRIPVVILTGTPDVADSNYQYLEIFKKGDVKFDAIFDLFLNIYNTGLTRIMGGRGIIEETLARVFSKNILPQKNIWIEHGKKDTETTEKSLLRYILNHLTLLLEDETPFFPEEVYICPPFSDQLYTGSIIRSKVEKESAFVIMTPACDLVIRKDGKFKTDRILLVSVDDFEAHNEKDKIKRRLKNSEELFLHRLPSTADFKGGFLNFRKIHTISIKEYENTYEKPVVQISPSFIKDIISRFSSYYARQGQPDIDQQEFIEKMIDKK
jgi:CheY-like chemotaxis protein